MHDESISYVRLANECVENEQLAENAKEQEALVAAERSATSESVGDEHVAAGRSATGERVEEEHITAEQSAESESAAEDRVLNLAGLPAKEQQVLRDIIAGKVIPPLYADAIAKRLFNPDVHADRLNFLMRSIAQDESIDVASSAGNENFRQSLYSKSMVSDIPSWLRDGRLTDLEMQKAKQDFIFTRIELYASDMLLLQYSVREGQAKGDLDYSNVNEALLIILMVESPEAFRIFDKKSGKYIHRFTQMTADTGLCYPTKAKMMYVQLDKCLKQYKEGRNAEAKDGKPDGLQLWLSMIADVNDGKVSEAADRDEELAKLRIEARNMVQDKEVQNMLIQEKYDRMDWLTYGNEREKKGEKRGEKRGERKLATLINKLLAAGRVSDVEKLTDDENYRAQLFREFGLSE